MSVLLCARPGCPRPGNAYTCQTGPAAPCFALTAAAGAPAPRTAGAGRARPVNPPAARRVVVKLKMTSKYIRIRGAREHNLKDISLRIPKCKITIFTGVSGSGKASIVFDTIATEAQRRLYENFSLFIRSFLPRYPQPEADAIENLSMAVIVDQKRLGGGSHSTVGTITDIYGLLSCASRRQ